MADSEVIKGHEVPYLRAWRLSRQLTQSALSDLTAQAAAGRNARGVLRDGKSYEWKRVPQAQINRIENKGQRVLYTTIDLLAEALETTRDDLMNVDPLASVPRKRIKKEASA